MPALELVEHSAALLKRTPAGTWLCYWAGSLPFALALMEFWFHMTQNAFAAEQLERRAFLTAAAYVWMKCWHAIFCRNLMALLEGVPASWTPGTFLRVLAVQGAIQPSGLVVRPLAMLITLPYGWVHAFYQHFTVCGSDGRGMKDAAREAARCSRLWAAQNHWGLLILAFSTLVIFLNVMIAAAIAPWLVKIFTGWETFATMSPFSLANTTFLMGAGVAAYVLADPLFKAFYTVRTFQARSIVTGADLRVSLRRFAIAAMLLFVFPFPNAFADAGAGSDAGNPEWNAGQLDEDIGQTLRDAKFAWRIPRQKAETEGNVVFGFIRGALEEMEEWIEKVAEWVGDVLEWIFEWLPKPKEPRFGSGPGSGVGDMMQWILYITAGILAGVIAVMILKRIRKRPTVESVVQARPMVADLTREDLAADAFPEEEWITLADQLLKDGEYRLAVRALYLALLAHLSAKELIRLAAYKSDREYDRELARRAASGVLLAFRGSMTLFQSTWYGRHAASGHTVEEFQQHLRTIRSC
jgi:hypothetical protein